MNHGCRKCRREGEKLILKGERCFTPKCAITKRSYAPGQHGVSSVKKLSEYGRQLREKQKIKRIYNISESVLRKYYDIAEKSQANTTEKMISILETRLDNVLYRANVATSRSATRQAVSHGKIYVNNKKVTIPSYLVSEKDEITFAKNLPTSKISTQNISWLVAAKDKPKVTVSKIPVREEVELNVNENLVVEFYSR
jgi:small subunit ribosomal protein S4